MVLISNSDLDSVSDLVIDRLLITCYWFRQKWTYFDETSYLEVFDGADFKFEPRFGVWFDYWLGTGR